MEYLFARHFPSCTTLRGAILTATVLVAGVVTNAPAQRPAPRQIAPPASTVAPPASTVAPSSSSSRASAAPTAPTSPQAGQPRRRTNQTTICGNPNEACRTAITFQPYDLPFRVPASLVIHDTELFYAVILKSMPAPNDNCDIFIPESDRVEAQALFPDRKVFASRCAEPESLFYTNTKRDHRIMAVYAGKTLAEANRVFAAVKATGKFPGANVRRMRTGFNGT
jgi:hypothetical protein